MSESNVVFCVEWGVSPLAYAGKCYSRMKVFRSALPTVFLDRADYDYGAYANESLKRSELRW